MNAQALSLPPGNTQPHDPLFTLKHVQGVDVLLAFDIVGIAYEQAANVLAGFDQDLSEAAGELPKSQIIKIGG